MVGKQKSSTRGLRIHNSVARLECQCYRCVTELLAAFKIGERTKFNFLQS